MWWNEENWKTALPPDVSWREYADECLTYDHMVHRVVGAEEAHLPDTKGVAGSIPALPT